MTVEEPKPGQVPDEPAPAAGVATVSRTTSQAALDRYGRRMRRDRAVYLAAIATVVIALGITVGIAWSRGESAHTALRTAAHPAASVTRQAPSAVLTQAWQSSDRTAIGTTPYWGGTVVTYTADSVRGRDAATGAIAWSYTRTDRVVCQAVQDRGITLAIFQLHGNCDQITALDSDTGARKWTRTLDKDNQPLEGHPSYSLTPFTVMLTTPGVIYAIDPSSGLDRWVYHPIGCAIHGAVIGTQGALISQTCQRPNCAGLTLCGPGPQLLLRDASAGRSDADKDKANPDQIKWNLIGTSAIPVSADRVISALDPTAGQLRAFDVTKGTSLASRAVQGGVASTQGIAAVAGAGSELVWIAGVTYNVKPDGTDFLWAVPTPTLPTVTAPSQDSGSTPDLLASTLAVGAPGGIALLDPVTGQTARTFSVSAPPPGSLVYPFGTGFVLAGVRTTVYRG